MRHEQGIKQTSSKMKDRKKEGTALLSCDFIVLDVVVIPAFVMHINLSYFYGIHAFCSYCDRVYREEVGSTSHLCSHTCRGQKARAAPWILTRLLPALI